MLSLPRLLFPVVVVLLALGESFWWWFARATSTGAFERKER